jgi:ATP-dependent exoDNAse (exonuclease V) alpha subunit
VSVVLPSGLGDAGQQLLNRALLYTAVTRAQKRVRLFAAPAAIDRCLAQAPLRRSGLARRLWSAAP